MIKTQLLLNPKPTLTIISPYCQEVIGTLNAKYIYTLSLGGTEIYRQDFEASNKLIHSFDKYYLKIRQYSRPVGSAMNTGNCPHRTYSLKRKMYNKTKQITTQWKWIWANSGTQWKTEEPGVLQSAGLQRIEYNLVTEQQQQNKQSDKAG